MRPCSVCTQATMLCEPPRVAGSWAVSEWMLPQSFDMLGVSYWAVARWLAASVATPANDEQVATQCQGSLSTPPPRPCSHAIARSLGGGRWRFPMSMSDITGLLAGDIPQGRGGGVESDPWH